MTLSDVQMAGIRSALDRLNQNDDYAHPVGLISRIAGAEAVAQVKQLRDEYKKANDDASKDGGAMLSPEAASYWQEARGVLAYGAMVMANPSRGRETTLSRKCEHLVATFSQRVPSGEQGKFRLYDDGDGSNWDDRWHNTRDGFFPILDQQFTGSVPIREPMAEAQRTILWGLLESPIVGEEVNVSRLTRVLKAIDDDRSSAAVILLQKAAKAQQTALTVEKNAGKRERADRHKAKIAAGDQAATKSIRSKEMKPVDELFKSP